MDLVKSKLGDLDKKIDFLVGRLFSVDFVIRLFCVFAGLVCIVLRRIACAADNEQQGSDGGDGGKGLFHRASFVLGYFCPGYLTRVW